jgi:hypothetical protein
MRLVKEGSAWQIDGPEKRRARIAYASLEADRVVYTVDSECQPHQFPTVDPPQLRPLA